VKLCETEVNDVFFFDRVTLGDAHYYFNKNKTNHLGMDLETVASATGLPTEIVVAVLPMLSVNMSEEEVFEDLWSLKSVLEGMGDEALLLDIIRSMRSADRANTFTVKKLVQCIQGMYSTTEDKKPEKERVVAPAQQKQTWPWLDSTYNALKRIAQENGAIEIIPTHDIPNGMCCDMENANFPKGGRAHLWRNKAKMSSENFYSAVNKAPYSLKMCFCSDMRDVSIMDPDTVLRQWCRHVTTSPPADESFVYVSIACGMLLCDWHRLMRLICSPTKYFPCDKLDVVLCDLFYSRFVEEVTLKPRDDEVEMALTEELNPHNRDSCENSWREKSRYGKDDSPEATSRFAAKVLFDFTSTIRSACDAHGLEVRFFLFSRNEEYFASVERDPTLRPHVAYIDALDVTFGSIRSAVSFDERISIPPFSNFENDARFLLRKLGALRVTYAKPHTSKTVVYHYLGSIAEYKGDEKDEETGILLLEHHVYRRYDNDQARVLVNYGTDIALSSHAEMFAIMEGTIESWLSPVESRTVRFSDLPRGLRRLCRVTFVARVCALNRVSRRLNHTMEVVDTSTAEEFLAALRSNDISV